MSKEMIGAFLLAFSLAACVGRDFIREATHPRIDVAPAGAVVQVGGAARFEATYSEGLGAATTGISFAWTSADPAIGTIDTTGLATGRKPGQTAIIATANGVASPAAVLTVVADPDRVASVVVSPSSVQVDVGVPVQFGAVARDLAGQPIAGQAFEWRSSEPSVATIDGAGLARTIGGGRAEIVATVAGVASLPALLEALPAVRTGTLVAPPGSSERATGSVTLEKAGDGGLVLRLGSDFVSSPGPDLRVFLSPGSAFGAGSLSLGSLQSTSGAQSYPVPAGVQINTYDWVIVQCVPFNITFGYGLLH